jgi:RNA polymerase sigma factor (sigma-70 family)
MDEALRKEALTAREDQRISEAINREYARLHRFIRRSVADPGDAEDIAQEVFYELVQAYRMMRPVEEVTAWLFRVARNRITDLFRKKKRDAERSAPEPVGESGEVLQLEEWLPSEDAGPEAEYLRTILLEELEAAIDELPEEQREVFVGHELMDYSFQEMSERTGVSVNTLLSRKRYAVMRLRERLQQAHEEFRRR